MDPNYPDFEQPIVEIDAKINALRSSSADNVPGMDFSKVSEEIAQLEKNRQKLIQSIFSNLKPIQIVQLARHTQRPYFLDYVPRIFTEFDELQGDRNFSKGSSIVGGLARLGDDPVVIIGHQKGRKTTEKIERNFGMARPEDYRKALRLMKLAEKFHLPLFTFIDTPGAYPGMDAEERNQSEAIARNLFEMSRLKTPIISTVIGEGGSGGALGIAVGDRLLMLQYSTYSVISPEGCAAILWKDSKKAPEAADVMGLTADRLLQLGLIDGIIAEPLGGAHRYVDEMAQRLKQELVQQLSVLKSIPTEELLKRRYQRLMSYGL